MSFLMTTSKPAHISSPLGMIWPGGSTKPYLNKNTVAPDNKTALPKNYIKYIIDVNMDIRVIGICSHDKYS